MQNMLSIIAQQSDGADGMSVRACISCKVQRSKRYAVLLNLVRPERPRLHAQMCDTDRLSAQLMETLAEMVVHAL